MTECCETEYGHGDDHVYGFQVPTMKIIADLELSLLSLIKRLVRRQIERFVSGRSRIDGIASSNMLQRASELAIVGFQRRGPIRRLPAAFLYGLQYLESMLITPTKRPVAFLRIVWTHIGGLSFADKLSHCPGPLVWFATFLPQRD